MPYYEYMCHNCQNREDILKLVKDIDKEEKCSKCDSTMSRDIVNPAGYKIKGHCHNNVYGKGTKK